MKMNMKTKMEKQDADVKKMAKYLREGARMLDLACPECNNPIFQMKTGEKICVVCERPVLLENELPENENQDNMPAADQGGVQPEENEKCIDSLVQINDKSQAQSLIYFQLKQACILKLKIYTEKIMDSTDENMSSLILSSVLKLLEILEKLRYF